MTVGRFAPSPSGRMHLGNALSALLAYLSVRKDGGTFVLRIEDLDPDRCKPEYAELLKDDLRWLGMDWDREQVPQSQRTSAYAQQFRRLSDQGLVYPCYCTRDALHGASAPHDTEGNLIYAGTCRNLTNAQRALQTKKPAWRLRVPDGIYGAADGLQGAYYHNLATDCGDFILRRADGVYAYQLAVVTDDIDGGITQVVRGRDLLSSVPRQCYLYELLGEASPQYYHIPLLTDDSGRRLSKRDGDLDFGALRSRFAPRELLGILSHAVGLTDRPDSLSLSELVRLFDWSKITRENIPIRRFLPGE